MEAPSITPQNVLDTIRNHLRSKLPRSPVNGSLAGNLTLIRLIHVAQALTADAEDAEDASTLISQLLPHFEPTEKVWPEKHERQKMAMCVKKWSQEDAVWVEAQLLQRARKEGTVDSLATPSSIMSMECLWVRGAIAQKGRDTRRHVEVVMDNIRVQPPVSYDVVSLRTGLRALQNLPNTLWATVNYERVLEKVLNRKTLSIGSLKEEKQSVRSRGVVHMHGVFTHDLSRHYALLYKEYCMSHYDFGVAMCGHSSVTDEEKGKGFKKWGLLKCSLKGKAQALTQFRPLVFVGCGGTLTDPHFLALFDRLNKHADGRPHFVLGRDPTVEPTLQASVEALNRRFPQVKLTYITYGRDYKDLGPFLLTQALAAHDSGRSHPCSVDSLVDQIKQDVSSVSWQEQKSLTRTVEDHLAVPLPTSRTIDEVEKVLKNHSHPVSDELAQQVRDALGKAAKRPLPFKESVLRTLKREFGKNRAFDRITNALPGGIPIMVPGTNDWGETAPESPKSKRRAQQ
ncbi:hypothetical protein KIPB_006968 [Kipferlia bialata]|uniref:Uncharacterized protein n=1 Tax=Kipferlia bialata TaxID=797122 RepID=A0A391NM83_9EUKA|nr:hypothetical protein KIPB_006968 [Kipferlia bialata]|eukprot:g6968.t1